MTTAQQVLDFEGARLGQGGDETWGWYPLPAGTAWCAAFQSMSLSSCGIPTHYAWVSALFDDYRGQGRNSYDIRTAQPGDLVAFEWGSTPGGYDHVAMIISLTATGAWTRNGNVNGSRVQDLWFPFDGGGMAEIARPPYTIPTPTPIDISEAEMFKLINHDGREEWVALTAGGQAVHCWSSTPGGKVGAWQEIKPGIQGSNLYGERLPDGRLQVTVTAVGALFESHQISPGGGWSDWQNINNGRN